MGAAEPLSSEQPSSSESAGRTTTASAEEMPKEAKPPTKARKRHRPAEAEESTMAAKLVGGGTRKKRRRGRVLEVETDSPVAGMFIKEACDEEELRRAAEASELDDSAAFVHVTEESRQAIAAIPDIIGPARCALCKILFDDLFRLAMHRCPRIRHQEYRCEECEKVFSCPANLASHRRWHLPKTSAAESKRRPKGGHARHDPPMPVVDENGEEAEETEDKLEKMDKTEEEKGEEAFEDGGHLLMLQMAHQGLRERLAEAATALITLGLAK